MQREPERAHTHVTHRMCVRTQITWTWLCTRGKNDINTVRFSHKPLVSCLRPSMCSYDGESVHVLFPSYRDSDLYLPLYDWQTRTVWPKNIKMDLLKKKRHLHRGCPWGKLIDYQILISKWTIPLTDIETSKMPQTLSMKPNDQNTDISQITSALVFTLAVISHVTSAGRQAPSDAWVCIRCDVDHRGNSNVSIH